MLVVLKILNIVDILIIKFSYIIKFTNSIDRGYFTFLDGEGRIVRNREGG